MSKFIDTQSVIGILEDSKAHDIKIHNNEDQISLFDTSIICTGNSNTHVKSISSNLIKIIKENGFKLVSVEASSINDWNLIDLGDIVIHIMQPQTRDFYNLEDLWEANQIEA